jgi:DNA invertase Pin-like site-specific DNA recombinase
VTSQTIVDIVVGKTWAHLPLTTRTVAKAPRTYNDKPNRTSFKKGSKGNPGPKPERRTADYDAIRALLGSGLSYRDIARRTGTTHTTVRRVAGG